MENDNTEFKEPSPNEVRDLQLGMRHFFTNYPHEELKQIIWDLYRGWVYESADYVTAKQTTDMLLFYEAFLEFTNDVHEYCQYLNRTVLKSE
jgi:hypothetical protein